MRFAGTFRQAQTLKLGGVSLYQAAYYQYLMTFKVDKRHFFVEPNFLSKKVVLKPKGKNISKKL